jgi:MFS family permease
MYIFYRGYNPVAGDAGAVSSYKLTDPVTAFTNVGYKSAFGSDYNYDTKLKVSSKEQAVLYQNYLSQYYAVKSDACADTKDASTQAASNLGSTWVQTKVYGADGKPKYCYVTATKHQYDGVYGITGNTTSIVSDGRIYWEDIAAWLLDNGPNSIDAGAVSGDIIDGAGTYTTPTGGSSSSDDETQTNKLEEACYEHAKSLGWVICPMIFGLREVTESIYEWIEPLIRVNDTTVSQLGNQNSNLFKAWNTFRGFANIIFVILFMFIIFSQLTGWGIDNYGIKKMLPKLIITAILVNLSFIICAIAVDASNVIGKGIEGLFEQLGGTIMMKDVSGAEAGNIVSGAVAVSDSVSAQKHIIGEVVSWLVIAAGGIGVGFLIQGWAIIIPILLFLLTVIISIIFAMIILGLRQAIVIILIVLAPVAFACSVLPNTEPIFKKWLSAFKGILVVYPVVGALIGAGYFTSSLIYTGEDSGTGLIMTIVAGLLSVVPYFLIPSLTRKSLDGIGMIGSKIGNIGKGASARTKGAINGAEATKNFRADQAANAKYRRANSKLSRWMDNKSLEAAEKNKGKRGVGAWVANHTIASNGRLRAIKRNDEPRVRQGGDAARGAYRKHAGRGHFHGAAKGGRQRCVADLRRREKRRAG